MASRIILGLDIGGTKTAAILAEREPTIRIRDRIMFPTEPERGFSPVFTQMTEALRLLLARNGLVREEMAAIGISCGGPLNGRTGYVLSPPNLPGWDGIPIVDLLSRQFEVPVFLQNDANACALAEWKLGAGQGVDDLVFLTMGTGFGGGIIADGRLVRGVSDLGGEVGHVRLAPDGPVGFGKAGSMEGFCSGAGIAKQMVAYTRKQESAGSPPAWRRDNVPEKDWSVRLLAEYAQAGDPDALDIFRQAGTRLGEAVAVLMDILNPSRIVIGSIFVRCEPWLRPPMEAAIAGEALDGTRTACQVVPAVLGEQLGDYAAVLTAIHGLEEQSDAGSGDVPLQRVPYAEDIGNPDAAFRESVTELFGPRIPSGTDLPTISGMCQQQLLERHPHLDSCLPALDAAFHLLVDVFSHGGKLLVCGNGGSAADAEHIVGELMKGFQLPRPLPDKARQRLGPLVDRLQGALPAISLNGHPALASAFANDQDPALVFAQQVYGYGRPGDALLVLSTSGHSTNVVHAVEVASAMGVHTLALTGPGGGRLGALCEIAIPVPGSRTAEVQEGHLPLYHCLCLMLETAFFGEQGP